jgi:TonB family protein
MIPLMIFASITPMLWQMGSGAPAAADTMVQDAKNGEFMWKYYPPGALKRGEEGRVGFKLTIEPTGTISSCDVTQSSGFKALDTETCEIMGLYAHLQPERNADGRAVRVTRDGFINWKLPPGATRIASATGDKAAAGKPDKMICRKDVTTGSLISTTRMCMRASEWNRETQQQKQHWEDLQGRGYTNGSPGGGM